MRRRTLAAIRQRYNQGVVTWQECHLAGLHYLGLHVSALLREGRANHMRHDIAAILWLERADVLVREPLDQLSVRCDLARARVLALRRSIQNHGRIALEGCLYELTAMYNANENAFDVRHQLAICLDFVERYLDPSKVKGSARELFELEQAKGYKDNGRAHRSYLLACALRQPSRKQRVVDARDAYMLACKHHDPSQAVRAWMIWHFGLRGERVLRRLQHPFA